MPANPSAISLDELNRSEPARFVAVLSDIYEHSPWVAEAACAHRPFASVAALHTAMNAAMAEAGREAQLRLIRAHPQLAGKAAIRGELTESSTREQQGAGLDRCSPDEFAELQQLNTAYGERFGFPFILAVRGHTRRSIIESMRTRLANTQDSEHAEALRQIERIAGFRLADRIVSE